MEKEKEREIINQGGDLLHRCPSGPGRIPNRGQIDKGRRLIHFIRWLGLRRERSELSAALRFSPEGLRSPVEKKKGSRWSRWSIQMDGSHCYTMQEAGSAFLCLQYPPSLLRVQKSPMQWIIRWAQWLPCVQVTRRWSHRHLRCSGAKEYSCALVALDPNGSLHRGFRESGKAGLSTRLFLSPDAHVVFLRQHLGPALTLPPLGL